MNNPMRALVDTNVWVDNYAPVRQASAFSTQFIADAIAADVELVYPVHALKDVFCNLGATLKHVCRVEKGQLSDGDALAIWEIAWGCIENMCELATAVGADESDVWKACKYRSLSSDLEDNFVMVAAERAHASIVVTNDVDLLRKCTVAAYTPQDALSYLQATA